MAKSFLLAGGGTAGHVNPLLATASELTRRGHSVTVLGTAEGLEQDLVPRAGLPLLVVPRVPMPRRPSGDMFRFPGRWNAAVRAAKDAIRSTNADAVVGFGGYVSTPAYVAARSLKVPMVVHEGNVRPGMANKLGARFTANIAVTFADTPLKGAVETGLPLRPEITDLARTLSSPASRDSARAAARESLGWPVDAPVVLVTGGSQGAASVNAAVVEAVPTLLDHGLYVLHATGRGKDDEALRAKGDLKATVRDRYAVHEYVHDMATALAAADAVVCRSGAGTVAETTAMGIPALYVPLPHGNGEQALNARGAVEAGAAQLIDDGDLTPQKLVLATERMVLDAEVAAAMRAAAATVGIADGASRLADMIEEAAA
ncbi:undecaprenyldiphospho-muramoylpentapeptide beta-N-acetylglucosaminyltransferase [Demequina oxidasica]|uniref:undecaprenyldiphospho-muramoylpentapeptide beta-N-acetylglucosaminyltransferase n=1 Tax=Demequina oxidasica TaxID=676199 RepID=UPI000785F4D5|nr:undecaprenyldiphospho-muramoylpentapeptide beta-N-acetylglucosaminyltransferase [Demequina oxidasica]